MKKPGWMYLYLMVPTLVWRKGTGKSAAFRGAGGKSPRSTISGAFPVCSSRRSRHFFRSF
ncbi:hypothetical protein [Halobacillus sp. B23F22_1]|uniref:hypothetical protein n=1 Tax=Halobacillus sp. B23F22_1 TaxID=3459514 RepID=UPI00373E8B4F